MAADVRGIPSHGVNRLELYCDELLRKAVDAHGIPVLLVRRLEGCQREGEGLMWQ